MFRLLKSGLPKDPIYPADLEKLGYLINEEDEVRMITNPRAYFNFFLTKNDRHNAIQREAMNSCLRDEVLKRLHDLGLDTVRLPLGAEENEPHIPILVSSKIFEKKRIIILFYEHTQDLGVFAYRVIGGRGGINAGSAVDFVKHIQSLSGPNGEGSPGIILANLGQLRWWRHGKKAVTHTSWYSLPQKSAVSGAHRFDVVKNTVPYNRNTAEHVAYIFNRVVQDLLAPDAMLEVIAVSVGAVEVVDFLNNPKNWEVMEPRLTALALVATFHRGDDISNPWFAEWLRKRSRVYTISQKPASALLALSNGNTYTSLDCTTRVSECYGCPVYSLGEPYYSELMLPKGYKIVLDWFQEVVTAGKEYENPEVVIEKVVQREEDGEEKSKSEESKEAEVTVKELKTEENKIEQANVDEAKADEVTVVEVKAEESTVGKSKLEEVKAKELSTKDSYVVRELKEAEGRSCMDWGEVAWEEEMKKNALKVEDCENLEATEEKFKVELGNEEQSKLKDTKLDKFKITDPKVEELNMDNLKIEKLEEDIVEKEGTKEGEFKEKEKENLLPDVPIKEIPMARGLVLRSDSPGTDAEQ